MKDESILIYSTLTIWYRTPWLGDAGVGFIYIYVYQMPHRRIRCRSIKCHSGDQRHPLENMARGENEGLLKTILHGFQSMRESYWYIHGQDAQVEQAAAAGAYEGSTVVLHGGSQHSTIQRTLGCQLQRLVDSLWGWPDHVVWADLLEEAHFWDEHSGGCHPGESQQSNALLHDVHDKLGIFSRTVKWAPWESCRFVKNQRYLYHIILKSRKHTMNRLDEFPGMFYPDHHVHIVYVPQSKSWISFL